MGGGVYEIIMGRLGGSNAYASSSMAMSSTDNQNSMPSFPLHSFSSNSSIRPCIITKICMRDTSKRRSFTIDQHATTITTDVNSIIDDEDIDIVVEVMGGTDLAKTVVVESLKRGKSVVTANKALIAEYLDEIKDLVQGINQKSMESTTNGSSSSKKGVVFAYEAAVCGGIPIIQALQHCFTGDIIHEVMGICNGTTNYMLGKMEGGASDYAEILKEAQDLGYAEADPTADVEGHDVRAKIAILAKLAFGTTVPISSIPCMGITQISSVDFEYAKLLGCTIKLVGTAERLSQFGEHDGALSVYVAPKVVPQSHLLASARGSGNAVAVKSANLGITSYTGPGAGRFPTANSIVADVCRVATASGNNHSNSYHHPFPLTSDIEIDGDYSAPFYIRVSFQDELGIIRRVGEIAEKHGVSISTVLQNPIKDRRMADFVITTETCRESQVREMCEDIGYEDFAHCTPLYMPMLE